MEKQRDQMKWAAANSKFKRFSAHPMNEAVNDPQQSIFTLVLHSGPLQILLVLLLIGLGIYHVSLSVRVLAAHRAPVSPGVHALLLFSSPAILILAVMAMLPTTFPDLFIVGIDSNEPLKHTLELMSFLGWLCLGSFVLNLVLALASVNRQQRIA